VQAMSYQLVRDHVRAKHPRKVLYRVRDSRSGGDEWTLRLELRGGQLVGQRYVALAGEDDLLAKAIEYNSVALQMLFCQLFEDEDSPYRITGISLE